MASFERIYLPTAYLPPVSWFASLLTAKEIIIEKEETFPKQTYRNRCHIYAPSGFQALVIPIRHGVVNVKTREAICSHNEHWQMSHWRTVETAYGGSPYFLFYRNLFDEIFSVPARHLADWNDQLFQVIIKILKLGVKLSYSESFTKNIEDGIDFRNVIHPKKPFPKEIFPVYSQVFAERHGFIADLSIIDLLFNLGPEASRYLQDVANNLKNSKL